MEVTKYCHTVNFICIFIINKYLLPLTSDVINDGTYREIELGWDEKIIYIGIKMF